MRLMIITLSILLFTSCQAQEPKQELKITFGSINEQAKAIKKHYNAALETTGEEKLKNERLFFESFPNSFKNMQELFGFDNVKGEAPLYRYETGGKIINYFSKLTSINKTEYYTKYINICVDGVWEADNIAEGFGFDSKLYSDKEAIAVLKQRPESEIRSVLRFCIDGPHPEDKAALRMYEGLYEKISAFDSDIAELLKQEHDKLLKEKEHLH